MIDEGFHPMTMYFPLVAHGALLMEPTETENRNLEQYIDTVLDLARRAKAGDAQTFQEAPVYTPRRRLDQAAARRPILRWKPDPVSSEATECKRRGNTPPLLYSTLAGN